MARIHGRHAAAVILAAAVIRGATRRPSLRTRLLTHLAAHPDGSTGPDLAAGARTGTGSLYPLLSRLEQEGAVRSWWAPAPTGGGQRRRMYALAAQSGTPAARRGN